VLILFTNHAPFGLLVPHIERIILRRVIPRFLTNLAECLRSDGSDVLSSVFAASTVVFFMALDHAFGAPEVDTFERYILNGFLHGISFSSSCLSMP